MVVRSSLFGQTVATSKQCWTMMYAGKEQDWNLGRRSTTAGGLWKFILSNGHSNSRGISIAP